MGMKLEGREWVSDGFEVGLIVGFGERILIGLGRVLGGGSSGNWRII